MGTPLMPWQQYVADVALEADPQTGRLVYREVVLTVPRQSGKTSLILPVAVHRAIGFGARQQIIYTAQSRNDARQKWEDEHQPLLEGSPLASLVRTRKRTGAEAFVWKNGSIHGVNAPTAKAGHGKTLDLGIIDEAFARPDDAVEQAFRPAMITRPQPQLWVVSTAGTAESTYLKAKVDAGRRRVEDGKASLSCYFEWSAPPDANPLDPDTWWGCMPALGHTVKVDAIRAELDTMLDEHGPDGLNLFRRAYLNQWVDESGGQWQVIGSDQWAARATAEGRPEGQVVFALAAAWPDGESASIGMAGRRGDEVLVQVLRHDEGMSWLVDEAKRLQRQYGAVIVVDKKGPAGRLVADLEAARVRMVHPNLDEVAQASGRFYAGICGDEPYLAHYDHETQVPLNLAVAGAAKRPLGDSWTWQRKGLTDISPLEAVSLAAWGLATHSAKSAYEDDGELMIV